MVDPVPETDRRAFARKVRLGFVLLVGLSCGLVALHSGGSPRGVAGVTAVGLVVGIVLLVAMPSGESSRSRHSRRGRR